MSTPAFVTADQLDGWTADDPYEWMKEARCADADPDLFFLERGGQSAAAAIAVCDRCPVRDACLDYAIDGGIVDGIFGGLGPGRRKRIAAERAAQVAA